MDNKKNKILLVDDEPDVVSMTKMRLEASGYQVLTAFDRNSAYAMLTGEIPDLIILDLMVTGMDGYQFCQFVKTDAQLRHIPIIILTAKSQKEDTQSSASVGADYFLTKPVEVKELLPKIKELLEKI